jgi:ligand-binding sensor domain-containing protein
MKPALALIAIGTLAFLLGAAPVLGLDPSLDISQYAHSAWTVRDGLSLGNVYAMAQTPDGYLWLGSEFGLFRFDGVRSVHWEPPVGQQLPDRNINALLVTRDGTLWVGTFAGLATWSHGKLALRPELGRDFVASIFEDRDGTQWQHAMLWRGWLVRPSRLGFARGPIRSSLGRCAVGTLANEAGFPKAVRNRHRAHCVNSSR